MNDPELLCRIAAAVRTAVPTGMPFSAKMRLGIADPESAVDCARALVAGGVDELIVHGRTKVDGYRPPARWEWIARVREAVAVPVIANGEVWSVEDYRRCRAETGCADVIVGRGAIADPWLAWQLRGEAVGGWEGLQPLLADFWAGVRQKVEACHAPGRLKQWLGLLQRRYPEAEALFLHLRPLRQAAEVDAALREAGILSQWALAA